MADLESHRSGSVTPLEECNDDCVFLTCFAFEFEFVATLLRYSGIKLHRAETLDEADFLLTVTGARVLLCDVLFGDGDWSDCVEMLRHVHTGVTLILVAAEVDRARLDAGALKRVRSVFWKPLRVRELRDLIGEVRRAALETRS